MVWLCHCGLTKGPFVVWNKERDGNITAVSFQRVILPKLVEFYRSLIPAPDRPALWHPVADADVTIFEEWHRTRGIKVVLYGASAHTAYSTKRALRQQSIGLLGPWPACSLDLNVQENVWHWLKDKIQRRRPRPTNEQACGEVFAYEYEQMDLSLFDNLYQTMP